MDPGGSPRGGRGGPAPSRGRPRLCLRWQDNGRAEEQLVPYVDSLAAAIRADPRLGGRIASGLAQVVEAQGTFVVIGGALLRCLDLYTETLVKE